MNIWLVTTGSSDVQLSSDENWKDWWQEIKKSLYRLQFEPARAIDDDGEPYRLPARVLGIAYDRLADQVQPYLSFPLLQSFMQKLEEEEIQIDYIIVLVSDQESIFPESERETKRCPYWQDTCQLYPILENYLGKHFPGATVKPLVLKPKSSNLGLDNWDAVLELVQQEIANLKFEPEPQNIYVSHQAGTPAISSAVQFCSLAKFGDRVKFLVSNEYNPAFPEKPLEGSSYLRGIRIQEAKALLGERSYNYAGVEALIGDYIQENEDIKTLLNAAKNWNVARFDKFLECLEYHPKFSSEVAERTRDENWWWIAYEEAYLAVIREKQDNIVEAFFHSFRAFEYIFAKWGVQKLAGHFEEGKGDSVALLKETILVDPRFAELTGERKKAVSGIQRKFKTIAEKSEHGEKVKSEDKVEFGFFNLSSLFKAFNYADYKGSCSCLNVFFGKGNVRDRRNSIVHKVKGLSVIDLCTYWGISCSENLEDTNEREKSIGEWKAKLKDLLNCIVKEDFPEGFASLEEASLMAQVHKKLVSAIASL